MLISEEELRYLPPCDLGYCGRACVAYLWQHGHSERQLMDYARIHYPLTACEKFSQLKGKRLKERLSVEMLAKQLLGQRTEIGHEQSGKPFVNLEKVEISVSHSYNIYGMSISRMRHGMDIEQWGHRAWRVREKFLSKEEEAMLATFRPLLGREQAATLLWSAKEAVYKAFDRPEPDFKNGIVLRRAEGHSNFLLAALPFDGREAEVEYAIYPACILALCRPCCSENP